MQRMFDVVGYRRVWYAISITLFGASVLAFAVWGLKLGIDFTGGTLMEIAFEKQRPAVADISAQLPEGFDGALVTPLGEQSVTIRLRHVSEDEHVEILNALTAAFSGEGEAAQDVREDRFTTIGPTIGEELRQNSVWAIGAVLLTIVLYISWAFRKVSRPVQSWQYGLTAIVALFHDVFIPVGIFSALGYFMGVEVDVLFITALLTVLGFSVHDTIVVFDRIRENLLRSSDPFALVVNRSVNETMARSINTSLTTLIVLVATYIFGGESIRYFVLTLIIGILFGTYSSIFIAAPALVSWLQFGKKK